MDSPGGAKVDGSIDFSRYTTDQLHELKALIDPDRLPKDANNLAEEIERRKLRGHADPVFPVRFTPHDGWRGWLEGLAKRSPLYGRGTITVSQSRIFLLGRQRTWLLAEQEAEVSLRPGDIKAIYPNSDGLEFQIPAPRFRSRNIRVLTDNVAYATELHSQLVARADTQPSHAAQQAREFNRRLQAEGRRSYFTTALVALNLAVFVAIAFSTGHILSSPDVVDLTSWGANLGVLTANGQWWRLISALFLHLGLVHLALNMWVLWNAGRLTERLFGNIVFLALYLGSGIIASATSLLWNSDLASVGASGAIFGLLASNLAYFLRYRRSLPAAVFRAHWVPTAIFVVFNLVAGALQPGVDNAAHLGGILGGFSIGWFVSQPLEQSARPFRNLSIAAAIVVTVLILVATYIRGGDFSPSAPQQFFAQNAWYAQNGIRNIRRWQELGSQLGSGILSKEQFVHDFGTEIVPFWQDADRRLTAELRTMAPDVRAFASLSLVLVRAREKSAQTVLAAVSTDDPEGIAKIQAATAQTDKADARVARVALLANADHRLRSLRDSYLFRRLRFELGSGGCARGVRSTDNMVAATDSPEDAPSLRAALGCQAQQLFLSGDSAKLDSWMHKYARSLGDLPDGTSRFSGIVDGLDDLFEFGKLSVNDALNRTADWRRAQPQSPYPGLIEAMVFRDWAYAARGRGYANAVSPLAMELFQYRLEMAAASLESTPVSRLDSPIWYELSVLMARDRNLGLDKARAVFDQGVSRFPTDWSLYSRMLSALMPRWGGSFALVDRFIADHSKDRNGPDDGTYARLYSIYAALEGDQTNIFNDANASWPRMKHGFGLLRARFPRSDYLLNRYARFACIAHDRIAYKAVRPELNRRVSSAAWSQAMSLASCDQQMNYPP